MRPREIIIGLTNPELDPSRREELLSQVGDHNIEPISGVLVHLLGNKRKREMALRSLGDLTKPNPPYAQIISRKLPPAPEEAEEEAVEEKEEEAKPEAEEKTEEKTGEKKE